MAQDTTPAMVIYSGVRNQDDTYQTDFEAPFDKGAYGEIKVAFVRRGLTDYEYDPDTYTVDEYNYVHWTGDDITTDDIICIVRITQDGQPYEYPNNQKHIERALDNLARQIQEASKKLQNALLVDPSWMPVAEGGHDEADKMDPVAWLQTIVRSKGKTLRELRIVDDRIEYTTDDPDSDTKTWNVIAGVKTGDAGTITHIRESKVLAEDGVTYIPYLEYSTDSGATWNVAGRTASELEHQYVKKTGDTMTGGLGFQTSASNPVLQIIQSGQNANILRVLCTTSGGQSVSFDLSQAAIHPLVTGRGHVGTSSNHWGDAYIDKVYTATINNGGDLSVPTVAGVIATKADVDLAANSGRMITAEGVWYAKMLSATTPPASAEVEGRNYADFSQVDGDNNPIIVIYTYTSGAWSQTEIVTPPADADGYVPVTSKIWDIPEQTDQQGGKVLWNHVSQEFTPYPTIITFEGATINNGTLTGASVVTMPASYSNTQIVNAGYVVARQGWQDISDETWAAAMTIELSDDKLLYFVDATADTTITIDASGISVTAGNAKTFEIHVVGTGTPVITWSGINSWLVDSETTPIEANKTSIFVVRVQQRPSDLTPTIVANYGGAY